MKTSADIRKAFLDYFAEHGHEIVPSSPLVPQNDPTLLFTNAGMVQFKDVFLGREKRDNHRAASSQRCVRAGGKHNDLENVGYTARHHTFFEMLGNFSFGDYFKREAIGYAWEFLTRTIGLPPEKLWVTVYREDDEAADIWLNGIGVDPARFTRIGDKPGGKRYESDNFWSMGDTGPCGPCSEIFYDHGEGIWGGPPGTPEEDGDRYIEIWNLVFMQYNRDADGTMTELPKPSVDTGMGLERLAAVMQGVHSNYEIDLFAHLIKATAELTGCDNLEEKSLRVIADHIRSCAFLIVDGVIPSNEGRGYVLRRIIRRAIRHGHKLGVTDSFFYKLVAPLIVEMGDAYPELKKAQDRVASVLKMEEERFLETIDFGMRILTMEIATESYALRWLESQHSDSKLAGIKVSGYGSMNYEFDGLLERKGEEIPVEVVKGDTYDQQKIDRVYQIIYTLKEGKAYSEYKNLILVVYWENEKSVLPSEIQSLISGSEFPIEVFNVTENQLKPFKKLPGGVAFKLHDTYGFPLDLTQDVCREQSVIVDIKGFENEMQAQRDRARSASQFGAQQIENFELEAPTVFTGYDHLEEPQAHVVALLVNGQQVEHMQQGESGMVFLDRTPFYAESGGQVGDLGVLMGDGVLFEVEDTRKQAGDHFAHIGKLEEGELKVGDSVTAQVNTYTRQATRLNHSATHLLHAALRTVLGSHVAQKGSLVDAERLRFDFSHFEPISREQLQTIEQMVNEQIRCNHPVETNLMDLEQAKATGAMALFGEKYADVVRVLRMGDFSTELCGGTHVNAVGDIGLFKITAESGIAAGVRRIEGVTGQRAIEWMEADEERVQRVAEMIKSGREEIEDKLGQILDRNRKLEKELEQLKAKLASAAGSDLAAGAVSVGDVKVLAAHLEGADPKSLRDTMDQLKNKLGSAVILLAAAADGKVSLVAGVTKDLTGQMKAGDLVKLAAEQVGGKGGGRPDMAMAGGSNAEALPQALALVEPWVRERLGVSAAG